MLSTKMLNSICLGDEVDDGEAARDGEAGHEERHAGGDDRGKDEDEDKGGDGERHGLGPLEIGLGLLRRVARQRAVPGELVSEPTGRLDQRAERIHLVHRRLVAEVQLDHDIRRVAGRADEPAVAGLRETHEPADSFIRVEPIE